VNNKIENHSIVLGLILIDLIVKIELLTKKHVNITYTNVPGKLLIKIQLQLTIFYAKIKFQVLSKKKKNQLFFNLVSYLEQKNEFGVK